MTAQPVGSRIDLILLKTVPWYLVVARGVDITSTVSAAER